MTHSQVTFCHIHQSSFKRCPFALLLGESDDESECISPVRVIFFTAKRHHRVIPAIGEVTRISGISVSHSEAAYTNSDKMQTTAFRVILITPMLFICMLSRGHGMGRDFLCCLRKSKNIEFLGLFVSDFQFQLLMSGGLWAAAVQSCLKVDRQHI